MLGCTNFRNEIKDLEAQINLAQVKNVFKSKHLAMALEVKPEKAVDHKKTNNALNNALCLHPAQQGSISNNRC